jgi:phosphoglycolate phosphatase-like HAD superfamily hydrolase
MTHVLFWDIDLTLLSTARAGIYAVEDAVRDVLGIDADLQNLFTAGLTDHQVMQVAAEAAGAEPSEEVLGEMLRSYERHLPERLHERQGTVLPGVKEILEDLDGRDDVVSLLLTGNTRSGAQAKLAHYGLDHYFEDGAFCTEGDDRPTIARRAWEMAERLSPNGAPDPERVFVIGDTPHDIRAAKSIGARAVAVAAGKHSVEELQAEDPWLVLEQLPAPDEFRRLLAIE